MSVLKLLMSIMFAILASGSSCEKRESDQNQLPASEPDFVPAESRDESTSDSKIEDMNDESDEDVESDEDSQSSGEY